ncbi:phosphatases II [Salix suchowensis]|nr:phosphatases II [Salix suchowensis]
MKRHESQCLLGSPAGLWTLVNEIFLRPPLSELTLSSVPQSLLLLNTDVDEAFILQRGDKFAAYMVQRSKSTPYCASALKLLSERENIRAAAREESRPREETQHGSRRRRNFGPEIIDHYSVETGAHPDQIHKNRYNMVEPYDRSRVVVGCMDGEASGAEGQSCGRYLNASWVKERYGRKWWIASQAPLPSTAHAFLSVILQPSTFPPTSLENKTNNVGPIRTVVQLTKNIEGGRTKAHPYFPDKVGQSLVLRPEDGHDAPALKSTLVEVKTHDDALCIESTVAVVPVAWYKTRPVPNIPVAQEIYQYGEDTGNPYYFDTYSIMPGLTMAFLRVEINLRS